MKPHEDGSGRDEMLEEELRNTPMFDAPDMWVSGSGRHLNPLQFFALTNEPRADLDGLSYDGFGLTEERCTRVDKRGIEVFTRFYDAPELREYRTGDKRAPQRNLFIRYDRALAARGVLQTVEFIERDDQGEVRERILLRPHTTPMAEISRDAVIRSRNAYLNALLAKRSKAEAAYLRLQGNGIDIADKLIADVEARRRLQKSTPPAPRPAAPLVDGSDPPQNDLQQALEAVTWAGETGPGTVDEPREEAVDHAPEDTTPDEDIQPAEMAPTDTGAGSEEPEDASPLADVLGGSTGFHDE